MAMAMTMTLLWIVANNAAYSNKGTKLGMFEELRNDLLFKLLWVLDHKGFSIFRPASYGRIASVDHVVGFWIFQTNKQNIKARNRQMVSHCWREFQSTKQYRASMQVLNLKQGTRHDNAMQCTTIGWLHQQECLATHASHPMQVLVSLVPRIKTFWYILYVDSTQRLDSLRRKMGMSWAWSESKAAGAALVNEALGADVGTHGVGGKATAVVMVVVVVVVSFGCRAFSLILYGTVCLFEIG